MPQPNYDSVLFAKYLVALAHSIGIELNVTKVQKLMYICYGLNFKKHPDLPLVNEKPQAWPFGPVFPRARKYVDYNHPLEMSDEIFNEIKNDKDTVDLATKCISKYGVLTATQLSDWSHKQGGAWEKTRKITGFNWGMQIPDNLIAEYFGKFTSE